MLYQDEIWLQITPGVSLLTTVEFMTNENKLAVEYRIEVMAIDLCALTQLTHHISISINPLTSVNPHPRLPGVMRGGTHVFKP